MLDIVPNHMAAGDENPFWRDPLWRAKFFDLDWRTGAHRRFFDVGELAGVRMEDPEVWEVTHAKVVELAQRGARSTACGSTIRTGSRTRARYLERLREAGIERVWVEKILEPGERLRPDWPVEGTTGYEFLNDVTALFVDPAGEEPLTRLYEELTGERRPLRARSRPRRSSSRRGRPSRDEVGAAAPRSCPSTPTSSGALASFHVYRTYVDPDAGLVDRRRPRRDRASAGLPDALARILLLEERGHDAFVVRFQQTTPPVHAKGVEDTAFYRWNRFVALNEVGGDPGRFSLSVDDFHAANLARPPRGLLATTTHDTKRSGDVRARLAAIAADPAEWEAVVRPRIARLARPERGVPDPADASSARGRSTPDRLELLPREGAARGEGEHELDRPGSGVGGGREGVRGRPARRRGARRRTRGGSAERGERIVLGMTLLKLTAPGVPDLYQGDELPFLALVDPDNRRPVDWELRAAAAGVGASRRAKLDLIRRTLALRARRPAAFAGGYEPLEAGEDVCAFIRGGEVLVAVAVRGDLGGFRPPPGSGATSSGRSSCCSPNVCDSALDSCGTTALGWLARQTQGFGIGP